MDEKDKTEIKIVTDDDESLKILGELLSNKTSRDLVKFLMSNSTYKNKISDELNMEFSLVEHHLKKLEKLGLVKITNKKIAKNGKLHKNYKINVDGIFVMFNSKDEVKKKGILKKIFRDGIKFAGIGIASFVTWSYLKLIESTTKGQLQGGGQEKIEIPDPLVTALVVIIIGLCAEIIYLKIKKRVRSPIGDH